jgi:hypothetical protein
MQAAIAVASALHKYNLHNWGRVTAEHHILSLGPEGKPQNLLSHG